MDTIFMNSENSKTSKPHVLTLKLTDKLDLRLGKKVIALSNLSIYYTCQNIKNSYNKNEFKISAPTWNDKFELPDGSYSKADIQDYFEYISKKNGQNIDEETRLLLTKSHYHSVTRSCGVTWQAKTFMHQLPQCLWQPKLERMVASTHKFA